MMEATLYEIQRRDGGEMWWEVQKPSDSNYDVYVFAEAKTELPRGYEVLEDTTGWKHIYNSDGVACYIDHKGYNDAILIDSYPNPQKIKMAITKYVKK